MEHTLDDTRSQISQYEKGSYARNKKEFAVIVVVVFCTRLVFIQQKSATVVTQIFFWKRVKGSSFQTSRAQRSCQTDVDRLLWLWQTKT
jgi:hypothetical protein